MAREVWAPLLTDEPSLVNSTAFVSSSVGAFKWSSDPNLGKKPTDLQKLDLEKKKIFLADLKNKK